MKLRLWLKSPTLWSLEDSGNQIPSSLGRQRGQIPGGGGDVEASI